MPIIGEISLNYATYRRIALSNGQFLIRLVRGSGVALLILAAIVIALDRTWSSNAEEICVGLVFVTLHELLVLIGWKRTRSLTSRPWRYEISSSTVSIHIPQTSVTVNWDSISSSRKRRHVWMFKVQDTKRYLVIPRAAFSAEAQQNIDHLALEREASQASPNRQNLPIAERQQQL